MSAIDAFMSTWSNARETLGQGTPQEGAPFDNSSQLRQMQATVKSAAPGERWTGSAADAYGDANTKQGQVLGRMALLDQRLGVEVDRSAAVVSAGRQNLDGVKQWVLDAAGAVPPGDDREQQLLPIARKGIGDVADVVKQTNSDLNAIGARIRTIGNEYKELGGDKDGDQNKKDPLDKVVGEKDEVPYDTGSEIPVGKDPKEVDKWWKSLPPEKQQQLLRDWPDKLGNLNGIPIADRNTANRAIMNRDLRLPEEIARSRGVTKDEVLAHPELYGLTGPTMDRYQNACKVDKGLRDDANNAAPNAQGKKPEILLMKYDPEAFSGKGSAAIAIGDPDTAKNTAVTVSGLTTSVKAGSLDDGTGVNLYNEANKADPHNSTAVVQWMGYDAPNNLAVAEPNMARHGGQILAADVNALSATHTGSPSHTTVIGHSYGSTTVADAASGYGMHADDVVLVGCPGTDLARSAADFHLPPGGHLYVGSASTDPVTGFGREHINVPGVGLGADPALDGYGSTRFHAEVPGLSINPIHDHTEYYTKGSESLFSMADIVSGHGDALEHDGMTADHRVPVPPIPFVPGPRVIDPETVHTPHNDHYH